MLQAQDFDLQKLVAKYQDTDTTVFVYMTALWCKPCLDKMPVFDAYFSETDRPYKIIYLFDRDFFTTGKLSKVFPEIDFTDKLLFIPKVFYSKAMIQINGQNKMFRNFILAYKSFDPVIENLDSFNLSSFLIIQPRRRAFVIDAPATSGATKGLLNKLFDDMLNSLK
jgi:thiol-disulfide isomerase/thioredoxin